MRTARIAGLVSFVLIGAFISAGPAAAASVGITKFTGRAGLRQRRRQLGDIHGKDENATSCTFTSSPRLKGLPAAVSCA